MELIKLKLEEYSNMSDDQKKTFNNNSHNSIDVEPEVIVIDNLENYEDPSKFNFEDLKRISKSKNFHSIRILCFIAMICCSLFALGVIAYMGFLLLLAAICLFQNPSINQLFYSFSKLFINSLVFSIGFALAILSPTLGIGFLILYFSLKGEKKDRDLLKKTLNRFFK